MFARVFPCLLLFLLSIESGCSSARSTLLHRGELDQQWESERMLHGVPITVQVPTHIRLEIVEHRYLGLFDSDGQPAASPAASAPDDSPSVKSNSDRIEWLDASAMDVPIRSVRHELIKTSKIFTVDPKRPAAGTMDATLKFGGANGQYFDQIDYSVEDRTLEAITGLIGKVAKDGLVGVATSREGDGEDVDSYLYHVDTVVASAMFSLDAPDLELQMSQFLERHLNRCHTCQVVPPGVSVPNRLPPVLGEPCQFHDGSPHPCPFCQPRP
jgi:hypothetical protein